MALEFAIVATLFMLSNFLYAVRKRGKMLIGFGDIRGWLDFHVFVGTAPTPMFYGMKESLRLIGEKVVPRLHKVGAAAQRAA